MVVAIDGETLLEQLDGLGKVACVCMRTPDVDVAAGRLRVLLPKDCTPDGQACLEALKSTCMLAFTRVDAPNVVVVAAVPGCSSPKEAR
jgi:hypothetical protein